MVTFEEIKSKCTPEMISEHDFSAIAATVSIGRVKPFSKLGGIGTVLETLGPMDGATLLDSLEAQSVTIPALKWAWVLINRGELDFGSTATRSMINQLIPEPARTALLSIAEISDTVTAAEVELAMKNIDGNFKE